MSLDAADRRFLCSALGFAAVATRGDELPKTDRAARAIGLARLIEEFCRETDPSAFAIAPDGTRSVVDRMVTEIVATIRAKGDCLPQDLNAKGFSPNEVARYWTAARALAALDVQT